MRKIEDVDINSQTMMKMDQFPFFNSNLSRLKKSMERCGRSCNVLGEILGDSNAVVIADCNSSVQNQKICLEQRTKIDFQFITAALK
jgi:hypothetical protein